MKVVLRSSSLLFSLLGITANAPVSKVRPLLRRGSAGRAHIGMSAAELLAEFQGRFKVDQAAGRVDIFLASEKQRRADLSLEMKEGVVNSIRVFSRRYKTESGIGPGDSIISLGSQHVMRWKDDNTAVVGDLNMEFEVEKDRITSVLLS